LFDGSIFEVYSASQSLRLGQQLRMPFLIEAWVGERIGHATGAGRQQQQLTV
jgi:hypothetical protein